MRPLTRPMIRLVCSAIVGSAALLSGTRVDAGTPAPQGPPSGLFAGPETVVYVDRDAVGSVRMLTNASGSEVARYDYLPFGTLWDSPALQTSLAFALMERDVDTGQDYAAARYFEARLGRFTSVDPGHVAGNLYDPQSWNGYAYAHNNPLRWVDPTGLADQDQCPPGQFCEFVSVTAPQPPPRPLRLLTIDWGFGRFLFDSLGFLNGWRWWPGSLRTAGEAGSQAPEKSAAPSAPIYCQADVISAMKNSWTESANGTSGVEASFRLDGSPSNYTIVQAAATGQRMAQTQRLIPGQTFALFHVHPNATGRNGWQPTPLGVNPDNPAGDTGLAERFRIQMYVMAQVGLGMYDGVTKAPPVRLRKNLDWTKPCGSR